MAVASFVMADGQNNLVWALLLKNKNTHFTYLIINNLLNVGN